MGGCIISVFPHYISFHLLAFLIFFIFFLFLPLNPRLHVPLVALQVMSGLGSVKWILYTRILALRE